MKNASCVVCCTLIAGLGAGTASAQPVSVKVTGHVVQWQDSSGLLAPYISWSQPVTAVYTYDTNSPAIPWTTGQYTNPYGQGSIVVTMGSLAFQSVPTSPQLTIGVYPGSPNGPPGTFWLDSSNNLAQANGLPVWDIYLNLQDPTGLWPAATAIPAGLPAITNFTNSQLSISGSPGRFFQILVGIDSVELVPPAIEVSPATGTFLPQQHFDVAVWLPAGSAPVATMQASFAANPLPLTYPGTCQLAPPNSSSRPALLCPGADAALTSLQGPTQIDWQVTLTDGTSITQSVQWNLVR